LRSYALGTKTNSIWKLILKINTLRDVIAHQLEKKERAITIEQIQKMCIPEIDNNGLSGLIFEGCADADSVVLAACGTCLHFLATFERDVKSITGP